MGTYSEALKKSVSNPKQGGSKLGQRNTFTLILGIVLLVVLAINIHLVLKITDMAREKDKRVSRFLEDAYKDRQDLENIREQIASASREISEFRTTFDLSSCKMKDANIRMGGIEQRLDSLDFNLHNIIKAKNYLFSRITKLEQTNP